MNTPTPEELGFTEAIMVPPSTSPSANEPVPDIRLLVVDDDDIVRKAVAGMLNNQEGITVVATARDGYRAIEAADSSDLTMVLLDIDMPGLSGIETAQELKKRHPDLIIIMYTAFRHESDLASALHTKLISGFLTKDLLIPELAYKLRQAAQGKTVYSTRPIELLTDSYVTAVPDPEEYREFREAVAALPEPQKEVFYHLAQAKTYSHIAKETGYAESSVRTYASRIFHTLGIPNKAELALTAVRAEIEFPEPAPKRKRSRGRRR